MQAWMAMRSKISEAEALFKKDGQRRFLIPFSDGLVDILTKDEAMTLKKQGLLARDLTAKNIYNACYYWTDTKVEHAASKGRIPKREYNRRYKAYVKWFERHHTTKSL